MIRETYQFLKAIGAKPALFLHIQKTAGTSIVEMAAAHYGRDNYCSHGDFGGRPHEMLAKTRFVSGHFGYDFAKSLMARRYSFTFLRNPEERILSLYYFYRANSPDTFPMYRIAHQHELADFLKLGLSDPLVRSRIWNNQVWQLACGLGNPSNKKIDSFSQGELLELAKAHLSDFSHVGLTETFDTDMATIANALGMGLPEKLTRSNTNQRPVRDELSDEVRALLAELTELDRGLYEYAVKNRLVASEIGD